MEFMGNTIGVYFLVFGILLFTFILAKVAMWIFKGFMREITRATKSKFDDMFVDIIEEPFVFLIIILGIVYSSTFLEMSDKVQGMFGNVLMFLIIANVAYFVMKIIDVSIVYYLAPLAEKSKSKLDDALIPILRKVVKVFVVLVTFVLILNNFGLDVSSLIAGLGIGGLAFALAAKDSLANIFGSVVIFTDKPFEQGDAVSVAGVSGTVKEVGVRSTIIKTYDGTEVTIPNSKLADSVIENISRTPKRKISMVVGLTYGTSNVKLKKAMSIINDILSSEKIVEGINVHFTEFGAYSLNVKVTYWIKSTLYATRMETVNNINLKIKEKLEKEKIDMAFPTQTVYTIKG